MVYGYCCLGEFNPWSWIRAYMFPSPRLVVMKQLSELMQNLQHVHPYTTKRMHAFKSTKMKYIKTLHATCLLSTVIFNAVKTLSFCPKPWIIVQQKYENRGQHCWDCCNPCCQWAPVWQLMWRHPPLCGIPLRKCFTFCRFHPSLRHGTIQTIQIYYYNVSHRIPQFFQSVQPLELPLGHHMREYDVLLSVHQNPAWNCHFSWGLREILDSHILCLVWKALLEVDVELSWHTMVIYSLKQTVRPRVTTLKLTWQIPAMAE